MTTAILLAAGLARRFGSQKLLAMLPDGRALVEVSAGKLLAVCDDVVAVVGGDAGVAALLRSTGCRVVVNPAADAGMGGSIACGVAAAPGASAWLIALGDMPFIREETLAKLARDGDAATHIVIPRYDSLRGHPVRFPPALREELLALQGDRGARDILSRHVDRHRIIETDDSGVVADVDTPEDLA